MVATAEDKGAGLSVAGWLIGLLAVYFSVQAALRVLYASSLGLDEAEMMIITQELAAGYGSQPPLYSWLQIGFFSLFGLGVPALAVLHFMLLFATFVLMYMSAREVLCDEIAAAAAALALFTIPQLGWESQHSHTHTVLAVTVAAASLYLMLLVLKNGRWIDYILFGVAVALGILSKYNFALFALALVLGAMTIPHLRQRVLGRRMLVALLLAAAVVLPHAAWVLGHPAETLSRIGKFKIEADASPLVAWVNGVVGTLEGLVSYGILTVAVFAVIALFPTARREEAPAVGRGWRDGQRYVLHVAAASLTLVLLLVLTTRATEVRDRWYQPVLFYLPLVLFILFERRLTEAKAKAVGVVSAMLALAALIGLVVIHFLPEVGRSPRPALAPYASLASDIRKLGFDSGYILADSKEVAGNLRHRFPDSTAAEPEYGLWPVLGRPPRSLLVAWAGTRDRPRRDLIRLWSQLCGSEPDEGALPASLVKTYEHARDATFRLNVIVQPMCDPFDAPVRGR